ncbi:hypothetical protein BC936DRAFT_147945 [Jimgerdemannia flammicorona]|uniref:Uncharacterized protein n=1 Tax=Jimgerdemannia flammicorona TaxID=994334 RepID=A0A433DKT5_9FUNG|nr:hypothetical protein BC936DRAFT_147945 [Jimgerdemannia flammicorona]
MPVNKDDLNVEYHPVGLVYWRDRQDRYRQTARRRYRRHCPGLGRGTSLRYHERQHWQVGCLQAGKHREEDLK